MDLRQNAVTLLLVALAAALGIYVFVIDRGSVTTGEIDARKHNLLPVFRRDDVTRIRIDQLAPIASDETPDGGARAFHPQVVRLVRGADGELALEETGERADTAAVRKLLTALEFATPERPVGTSLDRATMGLASPRLRVHIEMGHVAYDLALGSDAPTPRGAVYGELASTGVAVGGWFVIGRELTAALEQPRDAYRDRTLLPLSLSDVDEIELGGRGGERTLVRRPWGWGLTLSGPNDGAGAATGSALADGGAVRAVRVDRTRAESILTALSELRADGFPASPPAAGSGSGDRVRVRLATRSGKTATFVVGGACEGHPGSIAAVRESPEPRTACVPDGILAPLSFTETELFDRHLFAAESDEIESIDLAEAGARLELARRGSSWHLRAPEDEPVEAEAGNAIAASLAAAAGEPVESTAPNRGSWPGHARIVRLGPEGAGAKDGATTEGASDEIVDVAERGPDGSALVYREQDGVPLKVSARIADALAPSMLRVRSLHVFDVDDAHFQQIEVQTAAAGPVVQRLARGPDGAWRLVAPAGFSIDGEAAHDLAETVAGLRAKRWASDRDRGAFGLAIPSGHVEARLSADAGAGDLAIDLGARAEDGTYARRRGDDVVFVLDDAAVQTLTAWVIDRSLLPESLASVAKIAVRPRGAAPRVLSGAGADLTTAKQALDGFHADAAVHPGPAHREERFDAPELTISFDQPDTAPRPLRFALRFGASTVWNGEPARFVRRSDVDATFVVREATYTTLAEAVAPL